MSRLLRFYRSIARLWPSLDIPVLNVALRDESDLALDPWHFGILLLNLAYVKDIVLSLTRRTTH